MLDALACKGSASRAKCKTKNDFFVFISEAKPTLGAAKGSASRAKCKTKKHFLFFLLRRSLPWALATPTSSDSEACLQLSLKAGFDK
ncbi:MAG: hypothetical protein IKI26_06200, partial [Prevotella sp.]|nr:hypothetical protein [Prevotella sp.]